MATMPKHPTMGQPERSNLSRRRIIGVEPIQSLLHAHLLPVSRRSRPYELISYQIGATRDR